MASKDESVSTIVVAMGSSSFAPGSPGKSDFISPDTPAQSRRTKDLEDESSKQQQRFISRADSDASSVEDERCLICMNGFTDEEPAVSIPCTLKCNSAVVHTKCVYEWKERHNGKGTCPLCRAPLGELDTLPIDQYGSHKFHIPSERKNFIVNPLDPSFGLVRCYVRVTRSSFIGGPACYEFYLQAPSMLKYPLGPMPRMSGTAPGDQLLMVAKRRFGGIAKGQIDITLDRHGKDFSRESENYLGSVVSSFYGLDHVGTVPLPDSPTKTADVVGVQYCQNRFGSAVGPRKMRVALPEVQPRTDISLEKVSRYESTLHLASNKSDSILQHLKTHTEMAKPFNTDDATPEAAASYSPPPGILFAKNEDPYWLASVNAFSLDFFGRVTLPSNKNFILVTPPGVRPADAPPAPGDSENGEVCMQFGRVEHHHMDCYTMDVSYPLSLLQAAMIALSSCDRKLGCA